MMRPATIATRLATLVACAAASAQPQDLDIRTRWVLEMDAARAGETIRGALRVAIPGKYHVQSNTPADEFLIPTTLAVTLPQGMTLREIVYPQPVMLEAAMISDEPLSVFEQEFVIGVAIDVGEGVEPGSHTIGLGFGYQACDDRQCLMPTTLELTETLEVLAKASSRIPTGDRDLFDGIAWTEQVQTPEPGIAPTPLVNPDVDCDPMAEITAGFTVLGATGGFLGADDFIEFIDAAEAGTVQTSFFEGKAGWWIVLAVIAGGALLNLTPCVLPLIPINLAIIGAGAQAGSRKRGFALGGSYGLAMAVVYGGLGLIVTLTAATFGAINSTVWFNVAIAVLFVFLGLAMFDVFFVDFSKLQAKFDLAGKGKRGTFALAFGMGGVSALLAGACVAPVVIQVIVYAGDQYAKGVTIALALPFFLGLGMALPWPFAGAGLSFLPKPGVWMVRVKQAMGLFILAFAGYYAYGAWKIYDSTHGAASAEVLAAVEQQLAEEGWTASICDGLATARAEGKPVLIDMWATWCKNCLAMDKTTFKDPQVVARLEDFVKIKYQAENLKVSPPKEMIELFEQIGLPAYAILRPIDAPQGVASTASNP